MIQLRRFNFWHIVKDATYKLRVQN